MTKPKFTLCPPGPEPKRYTASCPQMVRMLMGGDDLTINQQRNDQCRLQPVSIAPLEELVSALVQSLREGKIK